jgi:hypothetical protein
VKEVGVDPAIVVNPVATNPGERSSIGNTAGGLVHSVAALAAAASPCGRNKRTASAGVRSDVVPDTCLRALRTATTPSIGLIV